jgi:HK97 family phage major capsid protein
MAPALLDAPEIDDPLPHHVAGRHRYSLGRALKRLSSAHSSGRLDGLEGEVSAELERRYGGGPNGAGPGHKLFLPWDAPVPIQSRAAFDTTAGAGGITTKLGPIVDVLRSKAYVTALGAEVIADARGGLFALPKRTGSASASWVGESQPAPGESHQQLSTRVSFSPKTVTAFSDVSMQSSVSIPDFEGVIADDLTRTLAIAFDAACLTGAGGATQPLGILNYPGVPNVVMSANGGPPTWPLIGSMRQKVTGASADIGPSGWLASPNAEYKLRTTDKTSGNSGRYIWTDENAICGFPAFATNQLPSNLVAGSSGPVCSAVVYGAWSNATLVLWGPLTLIVNPFAYSLVGAIRITALMDVDFNLRHPESFVTTTSMTTT